MAAGYAAGFALLLALPDLCYISIKFDILHGFGISCGGFFLVNVKSPAGWLLVMGDFHEVQAGGRHSQNCGAWAALHGLHNGRGGFCAAGCGVDAGAGGFDCVGLGRVHGLGFQNWDNAAGLGVCGLGSHTVGPETDNGAAVGLLA